MKKLLFTICLCSCLLLSGCGDNKTSKSIEEARKSNSVSCVTTKKMNYYDIEALKEQKEGTYQEGVIERNRYFDEEEERKALEEEERKKSIDAGTFTREYIYVFNSAGTKIEKVYMVVTSDFTHEEATDDLLKANKDYLDNYYKDSDDYLSYKVTIDGKKVIRQLEMNMSKLGSSDKFKITKQEVIERSTNEETTCKAN